MAVHEDLVEAGQIWEHRHDCRLCRGVRHAYLIVAVGDHLISVRDYQIGAQLPIGSVYAHDRRAYGSLAKGGLRLVGHLVRGRFEPVANPDDRVVEHDRIPPRSLPGKIVPSGIHG